MKRLLAVILVALVAASAAVAATLRGTARADSLVGTAKADVIVAGAGGDRVQAAFGGRDAVFCGSGRDVVSADRDDRVATDCEVVARRLSSDPTRAADAAHETAVEPDSFANGSTVVAAYQVGRFRRFGASAAIGWSTSTDAGRTWRSGLLPGLTLATRGSDERASDPVVAYDSLHGTWLVSALTLNVSGTRRSSRLLVSRSSDGVAWSAPVETARAGTLDKEWLACDNGPGSPYRGRCYVVYHSIDRNQTVAQSSSDGGLTWTPPVRIAGENPDVVGVQPLIRPDGTLVVVVPGFGRGNRAQLVSFTSSDGGVTFGPMQTLAQMQWRETAPIRSLPLPSAEVDAAGTLYVAWHDCQFRAGCTANDLVFIRSADGVSWTPPARIPLRGAAVGDDRFIVGLGADPTRSGRLGLVYAFSARGRLNVGFVGSRDGGTTWSASQALGAQPMPASWLPLTPSGEGDGGERRMVGDYFSVSFAAGRVVPVFTLATSRLGARFREAIFAASLPAG